VSCGRSAWACPIGYRRGARALVADASRELRCPTGDAAELDAVAKVTRAPAVNTGDSNYRYRDSNCVAGLNRDPPRGPRRPSSAALVSVDAPPQALVVAIDRDGVFVRGAEAS
jgi:hypothetical protein